MSGNTLLAVIVGAAAVSAFRISGATVPKQQPIHHTDAKFRFQRDVSIDSSFGAGGDGETLPSIEVHEQTAIMEGTSPRAIKLRQQIQAIKDDPMNTSPIILYGPRGSGKRELAREIACHLPSWQTQHVHRLLLDEWADYVDMILGTDSRPGMLDDLSLQANSTIIVEGFQAQHVESKEIFERREDLSHAFVRLVHGEYFSRYENKTKRFLPRVIGCTRLEPEYFEKSSENIFDAIFINVPSLAIRLRDVPNIVKGKIKQFEHNYGLNNVSLSKEAMHTLLDHTWGIDGNEELDAELSKCLKQLSLEKTNIIESKHLFGTANNKDVRIRLLYNIPLLRKIIMSPWIFDHTLRYIVIPAFVAINLLLWLGPQTRAENTALTIFWAGWWPGIMLVFPFLGRIWCAVCPFMALGSWAQEIIVSMDIELKKWPKWGSTIGPTFAFCLFYAILIWEELWDLPDTGYLSSCLLLLITAGAVLMSITWEKRLWCRYFCPIGAMNSMFSTLAMAEVRTWKSNCDGCTNPTCISGNSPTLDPSDKTAIKGCTMDLKNNQLRDMGDCVMCMSCIKNCEREAPELNLRPIGLDFGLPWLLPMQVHQGKSLAKSQVKTNFWFGGVITILQGSIILHYLPKILHELGMDPSIATSKPAFDLPFAIHSALSAVILAVPGMIALVADFAAVPLESLSNVWKRELTHHPAENAAIKNLYGSLLNGGVDFSSTIEEWDLDGDGRISGWELEEGFIALNIPQSQRKLLLNVLKQDTAPMLIDEIQDLYFAIKEAEQPSHPTYLSIIKENELQTKLTFIEIFERLDTEGSGYLTKEEFRTMSDLGYLKIPLSEQESNDLFDNADIFNTGRLNMFQFMSIMRKTVKIDIQEIGYGYLPLAWGSLTAYWLGLGLRELGLTLVRLPISFGVNVSDICAAKIPQFIASDASIHTVQGLLMIGSIGATLSLTHKLCADNNIRSVRFGAHATVQVIGALFTLYLMLSPELAISTS
ncbi:hypothetical protein ACHAXA_010340 [Cyclostephanos tholiformis]|uniref:Calmodulin n=1 Tax=Cyclostephanos tholiformis TaxID=382380 RepID=A0ABD3RSV3_9STRA